MPLDLRSVWFGQQAITGVRVCLLPETWTHLRGDAFPSHYGRSCNSSAASRRTLECISSSLPQANSIAHWHRMADDLRSHALCGGTTLS